MTEIGENMVFDEIMLGAATWVYRYGQPAGHGNGDPIIVRPVLPILKVQGCHPRYNGRKPQHAR